ncbi:MAG: glycine--tRNA ligase [Candidatus Levyibacteriota bacterium]|nr:MAG: glycine--tRNA ligase [Candidatus Levybacteria bacterium]
MEKLVALCKRRGFIFPGSELYGGLNGTWDLGPLGVAFANNVKKEWWKSVVQDREDVVGLDSAILHHPQVWEASGHVASFTDPLIECKVCHARFRADHKNNITLHEKTHQEKNIWTEVKSFNLMFKTFVGPIDDEKNKTYLRPETAQGIFINFKNVLETTRIKIPFGIAQIGKGFRNEITTGNFLFRVREFEMMELEFFVKPGTDKKWHDFWKQERLQWYLSLGIKKENIKLVDLPKEDIAHYSKGTTEVWYKWPFSSSSGKSDFGELEGIANRGDYDLTQHAKYIGKDISYFDQEGNERYVPYVIEPSVGVGRAILAFLIDAYYEEEKRVVLKLHPKLAPCKVAVFPLLGNKEELIVKAKEIYKILKELFGGAVMFDDRGNIGKRYLYQDEIGTPWCVTVDFETLKDNAVTVRDRDTTKQERIVISKVSSFLEKKLNS